ncbi:pilus assembly protein PilM [Paenibacillus sp. GSMTC-2017]|uniref:type IV pilus biogenesis protein PilM n=1 Tax=Paenibacillus sp. GSMTC-2017 TaxID=2794350 RepID=UPI0018D7067F|nr:pilus assembly protein PilM [Paenibacillus sp. GSMTC-2017]MBH5318226.1 pilus assembly protein PilM [Paenibacillus sp. GSMTC-2017]
MLKSLLRSLAGKQLSIGIELTEKEVKACELLTDGKGSNNVVRYASCPIKEGTISDGRLVDSQELGSTIDKLLKENKFLTNHIHFSIPSPNVMVRTLKLPDLSHVELKKLVHFEMKNNLRLAFEDPYYDFVKLPGTISKAVEEPNKENENENLSEVLVVAASTTILREYADMFENIKLKPISFEIKPFSLLRLLTQSYGEQLPNCFLIVYVSQLSSEVTIVDNGGIRLARTVEVPFQLMLSNEVKQGNDWLDNYIEPKQLFTNAAQDLIEEIDRLMNFYYYSLGKSEQTFQNIMLCGDLPKVSMDHLANMMQDGLTPQVNKVQWDDLPVDGDKSRWDISAYTVALGLALRGVK